MLTDCCGRHIFQGEVNTTKAILVLALKRRGKGVCTYLRRVESLYMHRFSLEAEAVQVPSWRAWTCKKNCTGNQSGGRLELSHIHVHIFAE